MRIVGVYSFNRGKEIIESEFKWELREVEQVIAAINSRAHKTKVSKEKTMPGKMLYKPRSLNKAFTQSFESLQWQKHKVNCEYPAGFYVEGYTSKSRSKGAFREMDFVKNRVGVEVQFGKYVRTDTTSWSKIQPRHRGHLKLFIPPEHRGHFVVRDAP